MPNQALSASVKALKCIRVTLLVRFLFNGVRCLHYVIVAVAALVVAVVVVVVVIYSLSQTL